ncbi:MAG TPA: hypothetical protein VGI85_08260 [Chthoniobacterales bacterium]|jgi:ABC-type glycerol-3-phosphate transport system substrate-binding protein
MKSKSMLVTGACFAAAALCAASSALAQESPAAPEASASAATMKKEMTKSERAIPYHGKIASVDSAAKTFTITTKSGTNRVFMMTDDTKIMKDGAAATMTDVAADEMVRGQYWKKSDGTMVAKSVMLGMKGKAMHHHKKKMMEGEASPSATP